MSAPVGPKSLAVFSTERSRLCPGCGRARGECGCRAGAPVPRGDAVVRVARESKGRRGKGVTVVGGLPLAGDALVGLAAELKRLCGSGGTVKEGVVEIQGDHRDRLVGELQRRGYRVKRSGG